MTQPLRGTHLSLWITELTSPDQETGWRVAVSRKALRLATQRNRWRRRVCELLRKHRKSVRPGRLLTFKLHAVSGPVKPAGLEKEILRLLRESGLWIGEKE